MFGFKPLGHPPLVCSTSFYIQNTILRKSIQSVNASLSFSQGKTHGKHSAARVPKHMCSALEIYDFMESCFLVFRGPFFQENCAVRWFVSKYTHTSQLQCDSLDPHIVRHPRGKRKKRTAEIVYGMQLETTLIAKAMFKTIEKTKAMQV